MIISFFDNNIANIKCWSKVYNFFIRVSLLESKATPNIGNVYNSVCVQTD